MLDMNQKKQMLWSRTHAYRDIVLLSMVIQSMVLVIQLQERVNQIQSAKRSDTAHKMDLVSFATVSKER